MVSPEKGTGGFGTDTFRSLEDRILARSDKTGQPIVKQESWDSLQSEMVRIKSDAQYAFFRPLIEHGESLAARRGNERDKAFLTLLLEIIEQLHLEKERVAMFAPASMR